MSETAEPGKPDGESAAAVDETAAVIPTLFDLLGHAIAAAHASVAASAAQLNVALAAYRLLQIQRGSLGAEGETIVDATEALRRLLRRDTGGAPAVPTTFNQRRPETSDSAATRGE